MKLSLTAGSIIGILTILFSALLNNWNIAYKVSGIIGLLSLVAASTIVAGFFSSTEEYSRGSTYYQTSTSKNERTKWSARFLLFSIPNFVAAGIGYFYGIASHI